MVAIPFTTGLHRLTESTYAYLQPPGTWGFSNCGLVTDHGQGVLIDTQFTVPLTQRLLDVIAARLPEVSITAVVTTHPNGDHCWGNELLSGCVIVGSAATADGMSTEISPAALSALVAGSSGDRPLDRYMREHFGGFDFAGISLTPPTRTFSGETEVKVGDRVLHLLEVGPAHTDGDVIVHVPDDAVVYAGDILFIGDHPIMWTGPVDNWIRACSWIIDSGATHVVPGHGPVTDRDGVVLFRDYLEFVGEQAARRCDAGMPFWQAATDIRLPSWCADWGHPERLVITLASIYRGRGAPEADLLTVLTRMAEVWHHSPPSPKRPITLPSAPAL